MKTLCEWGGTSVEHTSRCSIRTVTERHGSVITVRSVQQPKFTEDQLQTLASQTTDLTEDVRTWLSGLTSKKPSGMAEESQQSDTRLICQDRKASRGLRLALSCQLSARHNAALVHDSTLTDSEPNPEASHRPIRYDSGRPRSVI